MASRLRLPCAPPLSASRLSSHSGRTHASLSAPPLSAPPLSVPLALATSLSKPTRVVTSLLTPSRCGFDEPRGLSSLRVGASGARTARRDTADATPPVTHATAGRDADQVPRLPRPTLQPRRSSPDAQAPTPAPSTPAPSTPGLPRQQVSHVARVWLVCGSHVARVWLVCGSCVARAVGRRVLLL